MNFLFLRNNTIKQFMMHYYYRIIHNAHLLQLILDKDNLYVRKHRVFEFRKINTQSK